MAGNTAGVSPLDDIVTKVCQSSEEDWGLILEICDKVSASQNGPKDFLSAFVKLVRAQGSLEKIGLKALLVMESCVKNCGYSFHKEMCAKFFQDEIQRLLLFRTGTPVAVCKRLKELLVEWEKEFKGNPSLGAVSSTILALRQDGHEFPGYAALGVSKKTAFVVPKTEAEQDAELAAAIAASLQESTKLAKTMPFSPADPPKAPRRTVLALYQFEAKEEGELSFEEGDVLHVIDDSHPDWWKGEFRGRVGLFPSNFVQSSSKDAKKPSQPLPAPSQPSPIVDPANLTAEIEKLDQTLELFMNADPNSGSAEATKQLEDAFAHCLTTRSLLESKRGAFEAKYNDFFAVHERLTNILSVYDHMMKSLPPSHQFPHTPPTFHA
eukprot:Sdes_comp19309_c0_seq1m10427